MINPAGPPRIIARRQPGVLHRAPSVRRIASPQAERDDAARTPGARGFACPQGDTQLWCEETIATTPNPVFRRVEVAVYPDASKSVRLAWLVTLLPNDARNVF